MNAMNAKLLALEVAIECTIQMNIQIRHIFITNAEAFKVINRLQSCDGSPNLELILNSVANPHVYLIPRT